MPPTTKIQKEDILNAAYDIVRIEGMKGINARAIARKLNCSIQPIFYQFTNMDELKHELLYKIMRTFQRYITENSDQSLPYKEVGKGYIRFAKEEPQLFRIIFMHETNLSSQDYIFRDESYVEAMKFAKMSTKLDSDKVEAFHFKMWIFIHGIASMIVTKTFDFTDEQISEILTDEFQALILLEKEKEKNE